MLIYKKLTVILAYLAPIFAPAAGIGIGIYMLNVALTDGQRGKIRRKLLA